MEGGSGVICGLEGGGSGFHRLGVGGCGGICGLDGGWLGICGRI